MTALQGIHHGNSLSHLFDRLHTGVTCWVSRVNQARRLARRKNGVPDSMPGACADRTGTACVLHIIRKSEGGVHPRILAQMTGYQKPKLDKILHHLFRDGAIMIEAGGVYKSTKAFEAFRPVRRL